MSTFQEAVKTLLDNDVTLGLLTSIVIDHANVGRDGLERKHLLSSPNATIISPAIFINWTTLNPYDLRVLKAEQYFFELYFYQEVGYSTCEDMRERVKALLHEKQVQFTKPTGNWSMMIYWRGDTLRRFDPALGNVSMEKSRYEAHITRPVTA